MKRFWLTSLLLLLTSCTEQRLAVQSQYIGLETLASYHVNTPDPHLNHPPIGERLIISVLFFSVVFTVICLLAKKHLCDLT